MKELFTVFGWRCSSTLKAIFNPRGIRIIHQSFVGFLLDVGIIHTVMKTQHQNPGFLST